MKFQNGGFSLVIGVKISAVYPLQGLSFSIVLKTDVVFAWTAGGEESFSKNGALDSIFIWKARIILIERFIDKPDSVGRFYENS